MEKPRILVTGATGYIGGRLIPRLLELGYRVRCMTRDPRKLAFDPWHDDVEVVKADVLDPDSLAVALDGCDFAYYLVHSMGYADNFGETDRTGAINFQEAADAARLKRVVYLGGLGSAEEGDLSKHLSSRHEVGRLLAAGATPVTELRAAVIIGSGSVSFEMLRYLTEVLPIMTTPTWVRTRCQPIAIRAVLQILTAVLEDGEGASRVVEVGGPEILTYEEMMQIYAEEAGLRRRIIIPVPVLSPGLSSRWVGLVTPLPVGVARPLVDSLKNEVIVTDDSADRFPHETITYRASVRLALDRTTAREVETRWSDTATSPALPLPTDPSWSGGARFEDQRVVTTEAPPESVFWAFSRVGGEFGYYGFSWAWRLRGLLDSLVGGVGLRRGRRDPEDIRPGEALDFWRVRKVDPGKHLLLEAEMKLPGDAWLEWTAEPTGIGTRLTQTATFVPRGLFGRLYWWSLIPFHGPIFGTMARRIAEAALTRSADTPTQ
ncbi:MAG: SDR family oxidoreductase [Acidimicrobiia bacterium]|nr:SDR family oxidoreductase [Acidimicrobiia bacterium]